MSNDATGLSIFDSGTAAGTFTVVLRGYDRDEVNVYISRVEKARKDAEEEVTRRREENTRLTGRLSEVEEKLREVGEPTYAGLGRRVEELLRLAEGQANDIRGKADDYARDRADDANLSAAKVRRDADQYAVRIRREVSEASSKAKLAESAAAKAARDAHVEAVATRTAQLAAEAERQQAALAAERAAHERSLRAAAEQHRALVERETTSLQARLAKDKETVATEIANRLAAAENQAREIVAEAENRARIADERAAEAAGRAEVTVRLSDERADATLTHVKTQGEQILAEARAEAERIVAEAQADGQVQKARLDQHLTGLTRERDDLVHYLMGLRKAISDIDEGDGEGRSEGTPGQGGQGGQTS